MQHSAFCSSTHLNLFFFFFPLVMEINPIGATYCPFWREKLDLSAPLNVNQSLTTTLRILLYYEYLSQLF